MKIGWFFNTFIFIIMKKSELKKVIKESVNSYISLHEELMLEFSDYEDSVFCESENKRLSEGRKDVAEDEFIISEPNAKLTNIPSFNIGLDLSWRRLMSC